MFWPSLNGNHKLLIPYIVYCVDKRINARIAHGQPVNANAYYVYVSKPVYWKIGISLQTPVFIRKWSTYLLTFLYIWSINRYVCSGSQQTAKSITTKTSIFTARRLFLNKAALLPSPSFPGTELPHKRIPILIYAYDMIKRGKKYWINTKLVL